MKERPIPFSAPMVRAILDGAKTQTRRVIKPQPSVAEGKYCPVLRWKDLIDTPLAIGPACLAGFCPHGQPGDRLWVRESLHHCPRRNCAAYAEDNGAVMRDGEWAEWEWQRLTLPSIYMPRWASRLTLEIESVRAERVQDISEADAVAEGFAGVEAFRETWDALNTKRGFGWDTKPWVWVLKFRKVEVQ